MLLRHTTPACRGTLYEIRGRKAPGKYPDPIAQLHDVSLEGSARLSRRPSVESMRVLGVTLVKDRETAESDFTKDDYVPGEISLGFWTEFGGLIFVTALAIAAAAEAAITLVEIFSLGCGFIGAILLSLIGTAAMKAKEPDAAPNLPGHTEFSTSSSAMIWVASAVEHNTKVNDTPAPGVQAPNYTNSRGTRADVFGRSWGLFRVTLAFGMIGGAFRERSGIVTSIASSVLAVEAIILSFVRLANHSWWLPHIICRVAAASIFLDFYSTSAPVGREPGWYALNEMSLRGDAAAFVITIVEYATVS